MPNLVKSSFLQKIQASRNAWEKYKLENFNVANGGLNGSYVSIKVGNATLENVPVIIQPGQAAGTIGLAFGYGRKEALKY